MEPWPFYESFKDLWNSLPTEQRREIVTACVEHAKLSRNDRGFFDMLSSKVSVRAQTLRSWSTDRILPYFQRVMGKSESVNRVALRTYVQVRFEDIGARFHNFGCGYLDRLGDPDKVLEPKMLIDMLEHSTAFLLSRFDRSRVPGETKPVVAGILQRVGTRLLFNYGRSYLARENAISIYEPELPLQSGEIPLADGLSMPGSIRDGSPDAWGRRVLINRKFSVKGEEVGSHDLGELTYLLESGSDRAGALDFQSSATRYVPRGMNQASLDDLLRAAEQVEQGVPLSPELDKALQHGTSLGGARPKALLTSDDKKFIAKFSMSTDIYNVVKAEYIAMRLAGLVGLNVSPVQMEKALGKDVLLVERFDRDRLEGGWGRKALVSALTIFELDEMMARHASYELLAEMIRRRFENPKDDLRELFGRLTFNILCGNTDDHARNHAAFWDGKNLRLSPAYDVCPQSRLGEEAGQGMRIVGNNNRSQIALCLKAAPQFLLSDQDARAIISQQVNTIRARWDGICDEAKLSATDRAQLYGRQFLNPFAFYDSPEEIRLAGHL